MDTKAWIQGLKQIFSQKINCISFIQDNFVKFKDVFKVGAFDILLYLIFIMKSHQRMVSVICKPPGKIHAFKHKWQRSEKRPEGFELYSASY